MNLTPGRERLVEPKAVEPYSNQAHRIGAMPRHTVDSATPVLGKRPNIRWNLSTLLTAVNAEMNAMAPYVVETPPRSYNHV
jgi:hypothetical protein